MFKLWKDFSKGIWEENPALVMLLGMCPTLAVTNTATNGFAMGLATTFVLLGAGIVNSLLRNLIPDEVRIPSFIVVIATFVTIVDYVAKAYFPAIAASLKLFIPLIVVNCLILGRSESFASKMPVHRSVFDALGMGIGFTWALTFLGIIRELLGFGTIFSIQVMGDWFNTWGIMVLPAGAFLSLGTVLGVVNAIKDQSISFQDLIGGSNSQVNNDRSKSI
ncbi:electron transport complex, RnfABCDGE type, E subunit [Halobacteroides halobius DSM 5150]|uniref:Ion-translocating oxidoreductase complex subunit E n=1 Tax=Halobacteroides halobius (strain ATCC 35273 / DSM 5150 / MD-1) TaxID=748449 RepID=L0K9E8_HALHC|nr:electron transport complex subunit E [Halobacteroides halobius]AGB41907.1 electron transport complex, RnfABCDGE type, E subunit [Halobacteroides halobius DSM 5150]